jgi:hypothetical protein
VNSAIEDLVLATIWVSIGVIGAFYLYGTLSPRIQKPQQSLPQPSA